MPFAGSFTGNYAWKGGVAIPPPGFDPYLANVVLLMHMDGLDGSTNFIDSSINTKTVTPLGDAQISTAYYQFGGASGAFNNINAYLTTPDNVDFVFGSSDWTIELFCRIFPVEADILLTKAVGFGYFPFQLRVNNGRFNARGYNSALPVPNLVYNLGVSAGPIITPGEWYHVAVARQGSNFFLYVNGTLVDLASDASTLYYSPAVLSIGGTSNGSGLVAGNLDEIRITKGVCRYVNGLPFSIPTAPFPDS